MASRETAPSAPWLGSFKSMISAPHARAISASAASRTLDRNKVMGETRQLKKKSTVEQPVEHPAASAATTTATPACCTATRGTTLWTRAALGSAPAKVPEIAAVNRSLSPHLAQLNLVGVAVRIGHDHGDGLPVPLGGC